ncbi:PRA1 family protein F2 [Benincasa hispida]|uniref:PRA1 family protein F2 n=1 Tax=Benincasa hispida TaxID=102211 RepID=UPI0018FF65F4|nr:PRA1 family protein F2 [Benincasa hispida]
MPFHSPPSLSPTLLCPLFLFPHPSSVTGKEEGIMGTYGTIPTEPAPLSNLHYTSRARERIASGLGTRRPWMEMIQPQDLSFPSSFLQLINRIKNNGEYFRTNYILIILFILFLCLLWQPISLVVFIISSVAWLYLYFLHDEPWVVCGSVVNDRLVRVALMLITVALLLITDATKNIMISMFIGVLVVFVHGALKGSEDVFSLDEEGLSECGGGRGVIKMPLKHAASSSFSLS